MSDAIDAPGRGPNKPFQIPQQLKDCRFIPLGKKSKTPAPGQVEHFKSDRHNFAIDDPKILEHISSGGNYGVIPRGGTCIIDCDSGTLWDRVPDSWRQSLTIKTGRAGDIGRHVYLKCVDSPTGLKIVFPGKLGDIRTSGHNSYVVGPGSIHPDSLKPYAIENDVSVLPVSWKELSKFVKDNRGTLQEPKETLKQWKKIQKASSASISETYNLSPENYLMPLNPKWVGSSIIGEHPIHGSDTGHNLHIDTAKGVWYCHRHSRGGDGLIAYAVAKGIIECSEAGPGCLKDHMAKVFAALEEDGIKPRVEFRLKEVSCSENMLESTKSPLVCKAAIDEEVRIKTLVKASYRNEQGISDLFIWAYRDKYVFDHNTAQWYSFQGSFWEPETLQEQIRAFTPIQKALQDAAVAIRKDQELKAAAHAKRDKGTIPGNELQAFEAEQKKAEQDTKALLAAVKNLDSLSYRKVCSEFASIGSEGLGLRGDEWDADPWMLGCLNGVIDLKTGELRPGQPKYHIRSVTATPHNPKAVCPDFERFVLEILDGNKEMYHFLQRVLGLALIGDAAHKQYLIMLIGRGRNGKDTLIKVINRVLGNSLCGKIHSSLLLDSGRVKIAGSASPEIMDLQGKRLVFASESGEGRSFDLGVVKDLSGGGDLKGRAPYGKTEIQFPSSHMIFLETNHRPTADASDAAFWYRVKCIEFPLSFVPEPTQPFERKEIKGLAETLLKEREGILNWLVKGCISYQNTGLNDPESVKIATQEYRKDVDTIGQFIDECCCVDPMGEVAASKIYDEYKDWCTRNNLIPVTGNKFGRNLGLVYEREHKSTGKYYKGLALKTPM